MAIQLIAGLGNPGRDYEDTRHNAGAWFVEELARQSGVSLSSESRFNGRTARVRIGSNDVRLLIPSTFMNLSGQSVGTMINFFKIPLNEILVVHDELDIDPGTARLKTGGGIGGHNGLRDIIKSQGNQKDFHRLRIGIGHPGHASKVSGYVLSKPSSDDRERILASIDEALRVLPDVISGDMAKAMNRLHSFKEA
ncbi:MAG TPA: aminoacyl-tRNA hydrolase [Spongiibacteraceae bacterium]|nr:aminoacyl-tRNA hydrolase [Spongiibacteraceae bacterium]HCS26690.1 aminoacyl-tRNA hydrolase [Spongiibacteraceae bacterium]|tara:strand:- start:467 stop:1051 length:585 start_codon:yes stop_codon:yes gene_type:complete